MFHRQPHRVELPAADVEDLVGVDVGGGVVAAEYLPLVGESVVAAAGVDGEVALLQPGTHLVELVHMLGGRDEADIGVLGRIREFGKGLLHDGGHVDVREQRDVDDGVGLLHRGVAEVDEHVRPAHEVGVEVAGAIAGLPGQHHPYVVGQQPPEVVGDVRTAPFEPLGELEADLLGAAFLDGLDDSFEFVVPGAFVLERHPGPREVPLGPLGGVGVMAHYRTYRPERDNVRDYASRPERRRPRTAACTPGRGEGRLRSADINGAGSNCW